MPKYYVTGRVIVALNKNCIIPTSVDNPIFKGVEAESVEVLFQPQSQTNNTDIGVLLLLHIKGQNELSVMDTIDILSTNPCVEYVRPDYLMFPHNIPNDPYYKYLWGIEKIKAPIAWQHCTGDRQITVGVVDSGIDYNHPDLYDNMRNVPDRQGLYGWDFSENNNNPMDETGHGTHVAGTIGAVGNNYRGVTGICWDINIAALKIGNSIFSASAVIRAMDYASRNKIPILNCSWGNRAYCPCLRFAISNYNGLIVASAGNDGLDNDIFPVYPASFECSNIISVAATMPNNELAYFSNYGAISVDIAAPGAGIYSTSLSSEYSYMDGTSMAAPHVAGVAALIKAYKPNLSAIEIKRIIYSCVDKQPQLYGKVLSRGILNLNKVIEIADSTNCD